MNSILNSIWFWIIAVVIVVGCTIIDAVKKYRKGGRKLLKYSLKSSYNGFIIWFNIILGLFFIVITLIPMPQIHDWINNQISLNISNSNIWFFHAIPAVYSLIVLIIFGWMVIGGLIPRVKYNDEEKQWEKESRVKFKNTIKKWLHIKSKKDLVISK